MIPENFHLLRPAWLLALVPIAALLWSSLHRSPRTSAWRRLVDEHLLRHLLVGGETGSSRWPLWALAAAWVSACLALAGPTWERLPQPLFTSVDPTVVALDLSRSMETPDLTPSRRMRARYELQDVLERVRGGQVGLIVFSDEPFVALPLTDDDRVVSEWIPSLTGDLMPSDGNRADRAIDQAVALLAQTGAGSGRILLMTDGLGDDAGRAAAAAARAAAQGHEVSVLGMAPEAALDRAALEAIASAGNGRYATATTDGSDLDRVLVARALGGPSLADESFAHADEWRDAGVWLLFIPLLLAPLAFRRGWLVAAALCWALAPSSRADASTWTDLWQRRDQQGAAALAEGRSDQAAGLFESPGWRAAAQYQGGHYDEAAKAYRDLEGPASDYNLGNTLARAGDLRGALTAYGDALKATPDDADAKFNRDLVQRLLEEQEKQKREQEKQKQDQQKLQNEQKSEGQNQKSDSSQDGEGQQQAGQDGEGQQQAGNPSENQQNASDGQPSGAGSQSADQKQGGSTGKDDASSPSGGAEPRETAAQKSDDQGQGSEQNAQSQTARADAAPSEGRDAASGKKDAASGKQDATSGKQDATSGKQEDEKGTSGTASASQGDSSQDKSKSSASANRKDPTGGENEPNSVSERVDQMLAGNDPKAQADASEEKSHANSAGGDTRPLTEEEQAREQRLRQVPDDPGGLLRAKIQRRYAEKRYAQEGLVPW